MDELLIALFGAALFFLLRWGFTNLPGERWQMIGSIPLSKREDGSWLGANFTYYGLFNAVALVLATAVMICLMGAAAIPGTGILWVAFCVFAASIPAAKFVARLVEKKKSAFSVGAASFVGVIVAPWVVFIVKKSSGFDTPLVAVLAALGIAYAFGEGVGRLACVSFGCCYGKPLSQCGAFCAKLFEHRHFVFTGKTKKIAYAHQLDGQPVVPIQAVTSVVYCSAGLLGMFLYVNGFFATAYLLALLATQLWRFASEFFRSDYRGGGKISAYQKMSLAATVYGLLIAMLFPSPEVFPAHLVDGLEVLWDPWSIIFLQVLGIAIFIYMGKSSVTGSILSFHVNRENI